VVTCAQCGRESPDEFGFCPACGAPLASNAPARAVRKVVTVLFCDLTGSTAIGAHTDPEALRALMTRYYETARGVLERHGGTVEKFAGDAVMAVFGIPVATEDDALRATRAAVELREVVHGLGLESRIGVNTGAVVAAEGDTLVTGDAVNVAARLEQSAGAGEILLGDDTLRLVRDAVTAERVELTVKGKPGPVVAHRLHGLDPSAAGIARQLQRPMVGRERERERLRVDFADVVAASTCRLFTLIGPAGIGKSRLVADFLERLDGTTAVARCRALSYGEGITYWPLVEMLIQLEIEPAKAIRSSPAETQLATRHLLEQRAAESPLVLVVDDLQWAEAPMLDLVEHVADWSRAAPIFLLCIARPELLDVRPGWAGGKLNATSILLEPLAETAALELADDLLRGIELDEPTRQRILSTAEGNPLFLEEMAALAREASGALNVPPTIQALLQARLDTLNAGERTVIERGAVEGQVFHRGAVTALAPTTSAVDVPGQLVALVRKELVRPDETLIEGDDAFRFRHLLIRDTAYEGLPKAVRADLHERFAGWLEAHARLVEQDEIVGYHLEQAARYRIELDPDDARAGGIAGRAAERLGAAGRAALARDDIHATRNLLGRAVGLLPEGPQRRSYIGDLAQATIEAADREAAVALLDELERGEAPDRATATALRVLLSPTAKGEELDLQLSRVADAQATLQTAGDARGVARCEEARAWLCWGAVRNEAAHKAWVRALATLREAGIATRQRALISWVVNSAFAFGLGVDEIRALLDDLDERAAAFGPYLAASLRSSRARIDYGAGLIGLDEMREAMSQEVALAEQTGLPRSRNISAYFLDTTAPWLEGDVAAHELGRRRAAEMEEQLGTNLYLANTIGEWSLSLTELGDAERALEEVTRGREVMEPGDIADEIVLDLAEAYARASLGEAAAAEEFLDRARRTVAGTDAATYLDKVDYVEAAVRARLGEASAARSLLASLARSSKQRGFHRYADRYRRDLAALDSAGRH
jgi:class 3 adenylate cyclase